MGMDSHLDLVGSEVLDGIGHSSITVESRYHELLLKPMRYDLLRKRRIGDPQDGRSWSTPGLRLIFIDPLIDHLYQILNARSLNGSVGFALIKALLMAWGRKSIIPSAAPSASGVHHARL